MNDRERPLEERLAAMDFSDQSAVRASLRKALLERLVRDEPQAGRTRPTSGRMDMLKRPVPAFGMGVLAAVLLLTLAHPDGRAALARLPGLLHIGEHTAIITEKLFSDAQMDSLVAASDIEQARGERVFQNTPYGGWGGPVPAGREPIIKEVCSLGVAAGLVDFPLLVPTYFHEQLPARLRFQKVVIMPTGSAMLYFGVGRLETVLLLTPVGENGMVTSSESVTTTNADGSMTTRIVQPELEEMQVAGRTVVWQKHSEGARRNLGGAAVAKPEVEIGRFHWEQDGLSCVLNGKFLTRDEGIRIIESLKRYGDG
ncbi:MAG: hypothetical protein FJ189_12400 [Gammaproteobacteria bacterium]|nr:hypothetical protein [Gammaproteobacteria bacterium]